MKFEVPPAVEALREEVIGLRATLADLEKTHKRAIHGWDEITRSFPFDRASEIDYMVEQAYQAGSPCPVPMISGERPVYEAAWALSMAYGAWCRCKADLMGKEGQLSAALLALVVP